MGADRSALSQMIAVMRAEYAAKLPERLARIESLWRESTAGGDAPGEELLRTAHTIAGSAATFGLPAVGDAALELELALRPLCERGDAPQDDERAQIDDLLAQLLGATANRAFERS